MPDAGARSDDARRCRSRPWPISAPPGPPPSARRSKTRREGRAGRSRGALRLLGGDRLALDRETARLLERLPEVDWSALHRLADRIGGDEDDFEILVGALLDWLHGRVAAISTGNPRRLAPLAEVWEKVRRSARDTLALNLDKKTFLFSAFSDLAQATRAL